MTAGRCRICGCTQERACPSGCSWVLADLCSVCAEIESAILALWNPRTRKTIEAAVLFELVELEECDAERIGRALRDLMKGGLIVRQGRAYAPAPPAPAGEKADDRST